jgi:alkylation response protein AidB-like acyl-CoA dehydrogenase
MLDRDDGEPHTRSAPSVNLELTEDQEFFRETTRRFLEGQAPLTKVRELWDDADGFDRGWWRAAAELGWTSLFVPESFGGGSLSGKPVADAVIVAEEMGRLVSPGPFLPVSVVAAALAADGTEEQRSAVFPGLLAGDAIATWAFAEAGGAWSAAGVGTTATIDGDSVVLHGTKRFVEAAAVADWFLVAARTTGDGGDDAGGALTQVLVPADTAGVTVTPGRSLDLTRRFGAIELDGARLPLSAIVGDVGGADAAVERQLELALALQCAETVGAANCVFEFTVEYAQDRYAFGRPIASFQALKHRIADMLVWVEFSKSIADGLAFALDRDDPDAPRLASVAKAYVADRCLDVIDDCVQLSGGIGVTWEHDVHLYSRRVAVNRSVFGSPEQHKERIGALLGA